MSFPIDIIPSDDLGRDLQRAAPHVTDAGAWQAILPRARRIRRRRRAFQGGVTVLLAAMLVGAAVQLAELQPTGHRLTETTIVEPGPGAATLPPPPESSTAAVIARGDPDPRAVAVHDWIRALQAGDLEVAWNLLDGRAQEEYGTHEAFVSAASALTLRWGAWGGADSWADLQLIDLGLVDGERLAVATVFGQWNSGTYTAPRADALLVASRPAEGGGDGATVSRIDPLRLLVADDPSESVMVDEGRVPTIEILSSNDPTEILFSIPRRWVPGQIPETGLPLPGSVLVALFTVGEIWGDPDGPSSTVPAIDAPPLSEAASRAALESVDTLLRAVRLDDRASFVNLYAPTDRAAAEKIFADESARLQRLGSGRTSGDSRHTKTPESDSEQAKEACSAHGVV